MSIVVLHVYDVSNQSSMQASEAISNFNKFAKDAIGFGGIFHGGVEIFGQEWSYGYCENGSGVYTSYPIRHPMHTYRESVELGTTLLDERQVNRILVKLSSAWDGKSYDLLSRNCNHFCDALCQCLGVGKIPAWVNRFASAADVAVEVAENTADQFRVIQENVERIMKGIFLRNDSPPIQAPGSAFVKSLSEGSMASRTEDYTEWEDTKKVVFTHIRQPFLSALRASGRYSTESSDSSSSSSSSSEMKKSSSVTSKAEFRRRHRMIFLDENSGFEGYSYSDEFEGLGVSRSLLIFPEKRDNSTRDHLVQQVSQRMSLPCVHVSLNSCS